MQTRNKIFDDISQLMTNAMGVAQGAKTEAETAMKSWMDRWLADRDLVTREEFDAVRAMAQKAREENEALKARLDALDWRSFPKITLDSYTSYAPGQSGDAEEEEENDGREEAESPAGAAPAGFLLISAMALGRSSAKIRR